MFLIQPMKKMIDSRSSINQGITRLRTHSFTHSSSQCSNCSTNESNTKIDLLINRSISRSVFVCLFLFFCVCVFSSTELAIGDSCDSNVQSPDAQCVDNAECINTTGVCTCKDGYYKVDSLTCNKRE